MLSAALETEPASRPAFLAQSCGDDQSLREEVESLLSFETDAEQAVAGVVRTSAAEFNASGLGLADGDRVGAYRVVREIGRGGMGTVYLAERDDDQFKKRVAIKLVTRGMDTAAILGRFRRERQILARLEHPYIARLLDGGSTADGRPYLVMEYVEGKAITTYCAERQLGIQERIELFRKVCAAVQSAHRNLVVHRDLKPGNILVDSNGSPKLLDFGIAKLLSSDEAAEVTVAAPGLQMLTPDYASPEQVRGEAITTAADVYSLGAILYELLSGVRPHRLQNYSMTEIERAVCREDPERPSEAWKNSATRDQTPPLRSGDLDNVVLMALQKEPARRYGSPAELSEDLRRYLEGLPVRARQDTVSYRARKFVRRHRTGVAAAVLLVASLAGGVTVSTIEARRAQRRFNEVRGMAHAVLYDIHDAIRDLPGSVTAREVVVKTALKYLDGLAREAGGDPEIQLEMAEAYQRVGDVQGAAMQRSLGKTAEAMTSYRKALAISDRLSAGDPGSAKANLVRMHVRERLGDMAARRGNDLGRALDLYRQSIGIGEAAAARDPSNVEIRRALTHLHIDMAREDHDSAHSIASAKKALGMLEELSSSDSSPEMRLELAEGYSMLGTGLLRGNDLKPSLEYLSKAVRVREALVAAYPMNARYERQLMIAYSKVGDVLGPILPSLRDAAGAMENFRKTLAIASKLAAGDPSDARAAFDRAMAMRMTGTAFPPDRDHAAALAVLRQSLAIFQGLAAKDPQDRSTLVQIWTTQRSIARRLAQAGETGAAIRAHREVIRAGAGLSAQNPKNLNILHGLLTAYQDGANLLSGSGQKAEALALSQAAIRLAMAGRVADPENAVTQAWLPAAHASAGAVQAHFAVTREDWTQARASYEQSAAGWERIQPQHGWPDDLDSELARVKAEAARCAKTLASFR